MKPQLPYESQLVQLQRVIPSKETLSWTMIRLASRPADFVSEHTSDRAGMIESLIFPVFLMAAYVWCPAFAPGSWALFLLKLLVTTHVLTIGLVAAVNKLQSDTLVNWLLVPFLYTIFMTYYAAAWLLFIMILYSPPASSYPGGKHWFLLFYTATFLSWICTHYTTIYSLAIVMCIPEFFVRAATGNLVRFPRYQVVTRKIVKKQERIPVFRWTNPRGSASWCLDCMRELEEGDKVAYICWKFAMPTHALHFDCATRLISLREKCQACGQVLSLGMEEIFWLRFD